MTQAVRKLAPTPDHLLIDALRLDHPCAQTAIIYGDSLSLSIAAASVIAKVYRDRRMCEYHEQYPQYGLASHKGYSTPEHKRALTRHGPTPLHRFTFRPVAQRSLPWDYPFGFEVPAETETPAEYPDTSQEFLTEENKLGTAAALHYRPS